MIKEAMQAASREALRARDTETRKYVGNALAKMLEVEKSEGFSGWTEALEQDTLRSYLKALQKTIDQVGTGPMVESYRNEVGYLQRYLPQMPGEEETRTLIAPLAAQCKGLGQFIGLVMKSHKGQVDPALVRKIGTELGLK